jgi:hypothetical protein
VRLRLQSAYRPSTQRAHHSATVALALFSIYYDVSFPLISIYTLLSFIEFLLSSNLSVPTVKNYISSIKSHFKANNVCVEVFSSHHLTLALSSLKLHTTSFHKTHIFTSPIHSTFAFMCLSSISCFLQSVIYFRIFRSLENLKRSCSVQGLVRPFEASQAGRCVHIRQFNSCSP